MANGVYIGMSAALAAERRLEVAANNIANTDTTGFRQQRVVFGEHLVRTLDGAPEQKGFTSIDATVLDATSGALHPTGNPLDLAIDGDGYFAMRSPQGGILVSRAGNFGVTPEGTLVDAAGLPVLGGSPEEGLAPITVRPDGGPVSVGSDGSVSQDGTPLAQIAIVTADGTGLQPTGGAHLQASPGALRSAAATLHSGHLETSNVNPVRGMVDLVEVSHDYQASQKLMAEFRKLDRAVMGVMR